MVGGGNWSHWAPLTRTSRTCEQSRHRQRPKTQAAFFGHFFPQTPQLLASEPVFTQAPLQAARPVLQLTSHSPSLQATVPFITGEQTLSHEPQWFGSELESTQAPPQRSNPSWQRKSHLRSLQIGVAFAGAEQAVPQAPQLAGSLLVSTHADAQAVSAPQAVAHAPAWQTLPAPHFVPQPPQFAASELVSRHWPPQLVKPGLQTF